MEEKRAVFSKIRIANVLFGVSLIFWPVTVIPAIMIFDAPGSQNSVFSWLVFWLTMLYPVVVIVSILGSRVGYRFGKDKAALLISLLPFTYAILFAIWYGITMIFQLLL